MKSALLICLACALASSVACSPSDDNKTDGGGGKGNPECAVADADLIADFTMDNGLHPVSGRSGGFYVYGDSSGAFDPPKNGDAAYPIDAANGNTTCSGPGSFRVKATGFSQWGAAMGADFVPKDGTHKGTYDASQYKGVSFWAKAGAPLTGVQVGFPDVYSDAAADPSTLDATTSSCVYVAGANNNCSPYLVKFGDPAFPGYAAAQIDTAWKHFYVLFSDTRQDPNNLGFHRMNIDAPDVQHLTGMAIQVNAKYDTKGVASANDFELWVDDIAFIK
jgi:hypothetical protein